MPSPDYMSFSFLAIYIPLISFCVYLILSWLLSIRHHHRLSPDKKAVFISGCDSGIGLRLSQHLSSLGFVVFAGCLDVKSPGALSLASGASERKVFVVPLDVTKRESISSAFTFVQHELHSLHMKGLWSLINNAGVCIYGEFDWMTEDQVSQQVSVNLMGTILLTKTFLPLVKKASGRIIIVGSINGLVGYPGLSAYCATKFALEGFADVLRHEMSKLDVNVCLIRPGDFARLTGIMSNQRKHADEMWRHMSSSEQEFYKEYFEKYHEHIDKNYGMTSPTSFESSTLLTDFEEVLLSPSPPFALTVAPLKFRLFFRLLRVLPPRGKDRLLDFLYAQVFKFDTQAFFPAKRKTLTRETGRKERQ